jgi:hypothetical protein
MPNKIDPKIEAKIVSLYGDGRGTMQLAEQFSLSRTTIQKALIRNGVELRKTSPYMNKYNVHFFDEYTPESCYWAGFILADGCIRTDRDAVEIKLATRDTAHLVKFAKAIGFTGAIHQYSGGAKGVCSISLSGKWLPKALKKNFSIVSKKSLTISFPSQVPSKYWPDLIRGIFDGDGCITKQSGKRRIPMLEFVGTVKLLSSMQQIFYDLGVRLKSKNTYPPIQSTKGMNKKVGYLSYTGKNSKLIFDWMYNSSSNAVRLSRKYKRYLNFVVKYYGKK